MKRLSAPIALIIALTVVVPGYAAPSKAKPIAGGANQAVGVAGTFGQKLFNGEVRLVPKELHNATDADNLMTPSGQKWIVFTASASNGTAKALNMTQFIASVADSDGDTIQADPTKLFPMGGVYGIVPGGQWKEKIDFLVPQNFVPVKIVILPYDQKHQAFRVTIRASDYTPG